MVVSPSCGPQPTHSPLTGAGTPRQSTTPTAVTSMQEHRHPSEPWQKRHFAIFSSAKPRGVMQRAIFLSSFFFPFSLLIIHNYLSSIILAERVLFHLTLSLFLKQGGEWVQPSPRKARVSRDGYHSCNTDYYSWCRDMNDELKGRRHGRHEWKDRVALLLALSNIRSCYQAEQACA